VPHAGYDEKPQGPSKYEIHVIWRTLLMIKSFVSLQIIPCRRISELSSQHHSYFSSCFGPLQTLFLCWMGSFAAWLWSHFQAEFYRTRAGSPLSLNEQVLLGMPRHEAQQKAFPDLKN
jgi:hypothetical protein